MVKKIFGERLKTALDKRDMKQRELARDIKITEAAMSRYIQGTRVPRGDTIVKICSRLGISADWLLGLL